MVSQIRDSVLVILENDFTSEQLQIIDLAVAKAMRGYKVEKEETLPAVQEDTLSMDIREYIARKRVKGCSDKTIDQYRRELNKFSSWFGRDLKLVRDVDILAYLDWRISSGRTKKRTADNIRLKLSSFYSFMHSTGKMEYNPSDTVEPIKYKEQIRTPLTDIELECVRDSCITLREKALFEVLYSTGARVSEVVGMNWTEIDFVSRNTIITGKGYQERYVFFTPKALLAIKKYLKSRNDDNPSLFVSSIAPHERLGKNTIESEISKIGKRSGIGRPVFPHLLRHTFATDMLCRGAQINEVSELLGHRKLETTQIYAKTSVQSLKVSHCKHVA